MQRLSNPIEGVIGNSVIGHRHHEFFSNLLASLQFMKIPEFLRQQSKPKDLTGYRHRFGKSFPEPPVRDVDRSLSCLHRHDGVARKAVIAPALVASRYPLNRI